MLSWITGRLSLTNFPPFHLILALIKGFTSYTAISCLIALAKNIECSTPLIQPNRIQAKSEKLSNIPQYKSNSANSGEMPSSFCCGWIKLNTMKFQIWFGSLSWNFLGNWRSRFWTFTFLFQNLRHFSFFLK